MVEIRQTLTFRAWLEALTDQRAVERIAQRIVRLQAGLLGDVKSIGGRVSELRIDHGPGYRLYFTRRDQTLILLLCGGDKGSQQRDIRRALSLALDVEDQI